MRRTLGLFDHGTAIRVPHGPCPMFSSFCYAISLEFLLYPPPIVLTWSLKQHFLSPAIFFKSFLGLQLSIS